MAFDDTDILSSSAGGRLRFLLRDSAIYGLANAVVKLSGLVVIPILTRYLTREEFGASEVIAVAVGLSVAFSIMGQDSAVARLFYEFEDEEDRRQIVSQGLLTQVVLCVLTSVLLLLGAPWILTHVLEVPGYSGAFKLAALSVPFVLLFQFWRSLLKWTFARGGFMLLTLGSSILNLLFVALFVLKDRKGIDGYFTAQLICNIVFAALGLFLCRRHLVWPRDFKFGRQLLRFGWPYMAVFVAAAAFPAVDRLCLSHTVGLDRLAIYAIGFKVASLILFPVLAFQTAWGPFCYAIYKKPDASETYDKVLMFFSGGLAILCLFLVCIAQPLIAILASPRYVAGSVVVLPLVFGFSAEAISWITGIGIDLSKRTGFSLISYAIGIGVSVAAVWMLVYPFDIVGVAAGMAVGRLVQSISYGLFGYYVHPLRLTWKPAVIALVLSFAMSLTVNSVHFSSPIWHASYRVLLMVALIAVIWRWLISAADRSRVEVWLRGMFRFSLPVPVVDRHSDSLDQKRSRP